MRPLPGSVSVRHANRTWPEAGGDSDRLVEKEDSLFDIAPAGDGLQGRSTIQSAVDPPASMATECAWHRTLIGLAVPSDQRPGSGFGHGPIHHPGSHNMMEREFHADAFTLPDATDRVLEVDPIVATRAFERALSCRDNGHIAKFERNDQWP